jgi:hypothetical protein
MRNRKGTGRSVSEIFDDVAFDVWVVECDAVAVLCGSYAVLVHEVALVECGTPDVWPFQAGSADSASICGWRNNVARVVDYEALIGCAADAGMPVAMKKL